MPKIVSLPRLRNPRGPNLDSQSPIISRLTVLSSLPPSSYYHFHLQKASPPSAPVIDRDQHNFFSHQIVGSINSACARPWQKILSRKSHLNYSFTIFPKPKGKEKRKSCTCKKASAMYKDHHRPAGREVWCVNIYHLFGRKSH